MAARRLFTTWVERTGKTPLWATVLIGAALLSASGYFDWVTGPQIALSLIYVVPISWMTWKGGRWLGLAMCGASAAVWLWAELLAHVIYAQPFVPYWNAAIRLGLFCLVSALQSEVIERKRIERGLRQAKEDLEARVRERTAELQALNISLEQKVAERSAAAEERARKLAKSEADLQAQTNLLQSILNSMGDGVVVADGKGRLTHLNPAAQRMLHIPSSGSDAMRWLEPGENYLPGTSGERVSDLNPLLRAAHGEAVDGAEILLRHAGAPNGVWLSVSGRPLVDQTGAIVGGVIVLGDISSRKSFERQIAEISDREQRRLGEDLHDGLCQYLVSVAFAARKLAARLAEKSTSEAEEAGQIAELLGESIAQARSVARGLYLVPLEADGLRSALEEFVMQVRSRHRLACHFIERISVPIAGEMVVTNLFRIAQEAVNNSLKHAEAASIIVTLSADEDQIALAIEDDGKGIPPSPELGRGMGLHLMNYRARMLGATLHVKPRAGGGTQVTCTVRRDTIIERDRYVEAG